MFTFSVKLEKWSFPRRRFAKNLKEMHGIKKAGEGREKLLFLSIKCANFFGVFAAVASLTFNSLLSFLLVCLF